MKYLILLLLYFISYNLLIASNVPCCDCNNDGQKTEIECEFDSDGDGRLDTCLSAKISKVSLPDDAIHINLTPNSACATLSVFLVKLDGSLVLIKTLANRTGGASILSGWRKYTTDSTTYSGIQIKWGEYATDFYTYKFKRLGAYRHTRYTTPKENNNTCSSSTEVSVYITNSECEGNTGSLSEKFYNEVLENGSGISNAYGSILREYYCIKKPELLSKYPNAKSNNTFRQGEIKTACNSSINTNTVAINPDHPDLSCKDVVYIESVGLKTVLDHGGGVKIKQLDHWVQDGTCSGLTDLTSEHQVTYRIDN
ncbi:MAG: hypothetical protein E7036_02165 [Opitutales bacterium]|nr:hypothetical protein [Opitutales bacterium]